FVAVRAAVVAIRGQTREAAVAVRILVDISGRPVREREAERNAAELRGEESARDRRAEAVHAVGGTDEHRARGVDDRTRGVDDPTRDDRCATPALLIAALVANVAVATTPTMAVASLGRGHGDRR